jgi:hypothetical protein
LCRLSRYISLISSSFTRLAAGEQPTDLYACGCPFVDVLLAESELGDPGG